MSLPALHIGELTARIPIIQGGMGIGISLSGLAGAVAKEGGIGVISAAQPGFDSFTVIFRSKTQVAANCWGSCAI
ncbi:MAG: nitronate monooxygenase [Dialister invisus]